MVLHGYAIPQCFDIAKLRHQIFSYLIGSSTMIKITLPPPMLKE